MAWTRLYNSTTIDANEFNENFKAVRSGDLLPVQVTTTLSYTTGVYDLGRDDYKWNNVYVEYLTSHAIICEQATAQTFIGNIEGLNQDIFQLKFWYELKYESSLSITTYILINPNTTSSYNYYSSLDNTLTSQSQINLYHWTADTTTKLYYVLGNMIINNNINEKKVYLIDCSIIDSTNVEEYNNHIIGISNINTLTTIKIFSTGFALTSTVGKIQLLIERLF